MAEGLVRAIRAQRFALRRLSVLMLAATCCAGGGASENRTTFAVGARVLAHATLTITSEPRAVAISADDVQRGYVEILEPTRLTISSNSPSGYALVVLPQSRWFSAIVVRGAGGEVAMGGEGGTIVEHGSGAGMALELTYRFALEATVAPGRYPWPVHLDVQALQSP